MQVKPRLHPDSSCIFKKKSELHFVVVLYVRYKILSLEAFFINTLISYLFFPVTNEMIK